MDRHGLSAELRFSCPREMERRAAYVLATFLDIIGIPPARGAEDSRARIVIRYGVIPEAAPEGGGIAIAASSAAARFFSSGARLDAGRVRRVSIGSVDDVPVLFPPDDGSPDHGPDILTHDIISSAFYFLSNWEEIGDERRDLHGRYIYSESTGARLGLDGAPVVDAYVSVLKEMIAGECRRRGIEFSPPPMWPEGRDFALCLTHDVDCVRRYSLCSLRQRFSGFNSLCSRRPVLWQTLRSVQGLLSPLVNRIDPFWAFKDIMAIEKRFGFSSSFYFQVGGRSPHDTVCYRAEDRDIRAVMNDLRRQGFEVGLHGSYESGMTRGLMEGEVGTLSGLAGRFSGHRQHFLRIDPHTSFSIYSRAGIQYDTTLGYVDREGYRNGLSFPFNPYDVGNDRPHEVLEVPLTFMEWTLLHYRGLSSPEVWDCLRAVLERAREHGGCVCLLWHVHMFSSKPLRDLYERALGWARENNGWGAPAGAIYEWWTERRRSTGRGNGSLGIGR